MLGIDLAGGSLIFLAFLIAFTIAVAFALYGRRGSAITRSPYAKIYGGAPGASLSESRLRGRDRETWTWSRAPRSPVTPRARARRRRGGRSRLSRMPARMAAAPRACGPPNGSRK